MSPLRLLLRRYYRDGDQWGRLLSKLGGMVVVPLVVWLLAARG